MGPQKGPISFFCRGPFRKAAALLRLDMKIKVLFFASCRDAVGHKSCDWEIAEGYRVADLQRELVAAYPQLAAVQQVLSIAVNSEYAGNHTALKAGDEVALIPPVSGG